MIEAPKDILITLNEGQVYSFKIKGITALPDGTECFVLIDPNHIKHLLERKHYLNYHFVVGQSIRCRVDKINCNGKIYVEPLHPFYRIGKKYDFPLTRIEQSKSQVHKAIAVFEDVFCNEITLELKHLPGSIKVGDFVKLQVTRIKHGQLFVAEPGVDEDYSGMKEGGPYSFMIEDLIDYPGKRSFYIMVSGDGRKFRLRYKYFEKYNFKIGNTIECRLVKSGKDFLLEPRHPFYRINEYYLFDIIGEEQVIEYPEKERKVYILSNPYGKDVLIPVDKVESVLPDGKINCRVRDIRKGKLFLDCRKR